VRRPTLAQFMAAAGAQPVGICMGDISGTAAIVNLAQERLMIDPFAPDEGWWGGWVKMLFNVQAVNQAAYIVTPHDIARVIVMDVCQKPIRLRNGFYEYMEFGIGLQPRGCPPQVCTPNVAQAFERDTVFTLTDFAATPQYLRIYPTDSADLGRRIVLQGPDQNGVTILGTDIDTQAAILGETVFITLPFATTKNQFSGITGILKDPTLGPIQIFMIDPVSGTSTLLTAMDPNETTAAYRRYLINGLPCNCCNTPGGSIQISAQCKLDFVPVTSPSDYLIIQNIPALIEECQAIRYSKMDSEEAAKNEAKHHAKALQLLNGQLDHFLGKVNTSVQVSLFGSNRLRPMPI
jgi:hypothetical protein